MSVDDGNDNATFVVFDKEMLKLTKKDAATLTVDEVCFPKSQKIIPSIALHCKVTRCFHLLQMNGGRGEQLPQCLQELGGKEFVFHIRVTQFNFTPSHRTFTVCGISDHIEPEVLNI